MQTELRLSDYQSRVLSLPEEVDLFLGGGRGGGKSFTLALLALRHVEQYGDKARILYIRRTYKGLADFELVTRQIFGMAYGTAARYNAADHVWRLPNGAYLELGQMETAGDGFKVQGRSFTLLLVDEAGQYAMPDLLDLLRSNLRGDKGIPVRVVMAANPGGPGHHWLARRYVFRAAPWKPFTEESSEHMTVYCPSTYRENPHIDQDQYAQQLRASCSSDPELLRAWADGDWSVARGAYFAAVLEESRVAVEPWQKIPVDPWTGELWDHWLAHDFGSTAPSVTYLFVQSPGDHHMGRFWPRDSMIVVDELAAVRRDSLNHGLGWTAAITGEAIVDFCKPWHVKPKGVADDACFARTGHGMSIAEEFGRVGVTFHPAKKADRISGWQRMARMLADAGKPDVPGLYVSRSCKYFWATVPYLARDEKRIEDVDSSGPDHAADACRYGILRKKLVVGVQPFPAV